MALEPNKGNGLLILKVARSHTVIHNRQTSHPWRDLNPQSQQVSGHRLTP